MNDEQSGTEVGASAVRDPICPNCGRCKSAHLCANFADGPQVGEAFLVCPSAAFFDGWQGDENRYTTAWCACGHAPDLHTDDGCTGATPSDTTPQTFSACACKNWRPGTSPRYQIALMHERRRREATEEPRNGDFPKPPLPPETER